MGIFWGEIQVKNNFNYKISILILKVSKIVYFNLFFKYSTFPIIIDMTSSKMYKKFIPLKLIIIQIKFVFFKTNI